MTKTLNRLLISLFLVFTLHITLYTLHSNAAVPRLINYQGKLTDPAGAPLNGSYNLTFRIYDAESAGNMLWQETQSGVVVQKGVFSILLGSVTTLNIPFDKQYYLAIQVGSDPEMSPRQKITSAAYAIRAETTEDPKVKADSTDTTPGYLSDKVDNSSIKVDATKHKIYASDRKKLFTSSGTFTVPDGIAIVYITMVGGGGQGRGGSNSASGQGGGGASSLIKYPFTVVPGNSYSVSIGAGGTGGSAPTWNGGATSFSTLSVAGGLVGALGTTSYANNGNSNGADGSTTIGGAGGVGISGGKGGSGVNFSNGAGGGGGGTPFGIGGTGGTWNNNGTAGTGYGSGGGGGGAGYASGGDGASGFCLVEW